MSTSATIYARVPEVRRDCPLNVEWSSWRECHIEPDWLSIYTVTEIKILLARTATHADLLQS